jgi:uncharacterized protein (DUF362 family)
MNHSSSRRDFLKAMGVTAACGIAGPALLKGQDSTRASAETANAGPIVSVVQGPVEAAIRKALEPFGGMAAFVKPGATVVIKPNISFPNSKTWGTGTSPECVKAVALEALAAGAGRVIVADNTMRQGMESFERTGISEILAGLDNIKLVPIQQETFFTEIPVPNGKALKSVKVAKLVLKADVLINLPCAKSHAATDISFGLKNQMGMIWDRGFFHTGTDLHTAIAELATVVRPHLTLLDATRALLTGGPMGPGKVVDLNTVVAGTDMPAVDAFGATMALWNNRTLRPQAVKHLAAAARLGVGEIDLSKIRVIRSSVS